MIVTPTRAERFNATFAKLVRSLMSFLITEEELQPFYRLVISNPETNQSREYLFQTLKEAVDFYEIHFEHDCNYFLYHEQVKDTMNPTFIRLQYQKQLAV